jgi:hypothetical protein
VHHFTESCSVVVCVYYLAAFLKGGLYWICCHNFDVLCFSSHIVSFVFSGQSDYTKIQR